MQEVQPNYAGDRVPEPRNKKGGCFCNECQRTVILDLFISEAGVRGRSLHRKRVSVGIAGGPKQGLARHALEWLMCLYLYDSAEGGEPL